MDFSPNKPLYGSLVQYVSSRNANLLEFKKDSKLLGCNKKISLSIYKKQFKKKSNEDKEVKILNLQLNLRDKSKMFVDSFSVFKRDFLTPTKLLHEPKPRVYYQSNYNFF